MTERWFVDTGNGEPPLEIDLMTEAERIELMANTSAQPTATLELRWARHVWDIGGGGKAFAGQELQQRWSDGTWRNVPTVDVESVPHIDSGVIADGQIRKG
jgi:hypothetical protein